MQGSPAPQHFMPARRLAGRISVPGDKSISHRALILAGLSVGETRITGLLEAEDVFATLTAMQAFGATVERDGAEWVVHGTGIGSVLQPEGALYMGNAGTAARLLMGVAASHAITTCFTGDASLSRRPMKRVIEPLSLMGASFAAGPGDTLPLIVTGASPAVPIEYRLPVASAQVKSAVLLAALNAPGITTVIEPVATRDHTERMLRAFGADVTVQEDAGERIVRLRGQVQLKPLALEIPGDASSAAFFIVAALLVEGSDITIENVGMNPARTGLVTVLRQMGGRIRELNRREVGGEPVADLHVCHSQLTGTGVDPALVPSMIDEFPVLFVAGALATGRTTTSGLAELRVKESDRLSAMAAALALAGARVQETADGLVIDGTGGELLDGTGEGQEVATCLDHRIAMSMAVAGLVSRYGVAVDDARPIATSFPRFAELLEGLR